MMQAPQPDPTDIDLMQRLLAPEPTGALPRPAAGLMRPEAQLDATINELRVALGAYRGIHELCGTILATLTMPGNKETFAALPDTWHEWVEVWLEQYDQLDARLPDEEAE